MSADLDDKRIGIMGTPQALFASRCASASSADWLATRPLMRWERIILRPPAFAPATELFPVAQMTGGKVGKVGNPSGSVDRAGALIAIGPAHVGRQGEGNLAVVVARRRAQLEGLQALAAQFDVVHRLHALIAPLDDAA